MMENKHTFLHQKGFSLIEVMVGLVIGLLATLVIMQVFSSFEGQKRSTSGSADAQTNGSIALMNIQRNVQMAGYGLPLPMADLNNSSLKCAKFGPFDPDNNAATDNDTDLFPLVIQDGAGANGSDIITVRYSNTAMGGIPVTILDSNNATAAGLVADSNMGCSDNDVVLISNGTTCAMTTITDANGAPDTNQNIQLSAITTPAGNPLINGAKIACMGDWQDYDFQIVNNELQLNNQPIVSEVVQMQVQYGVSDSATNNNVTDWVDATAGGMWDDPTVAARNRIKAIRVAVVLRNGLLETTDVTDGGTGTAPAPVSWTTPLNGSAAPAIDLSADPNWRRYRYRVFETIIPLRNMLWSREAV